VLFVVGEIYLFLFQLLIVDHFCVRVLIPSTMLPEVFSSFTLLLQMKKKTLVVLVPAELSWLQRAEYIVTWRHCTGTLAWHLS
jgi:hypothetical protein